MKILVVPDLHGIDTWKRQVYESLVTDDTHIIFLGDYADSYIISLDKIIVNLHDVINIKKQFPNKVTLLLGNHDYCYMFNKLTLSNFDYKYMKFLIILKNKFLYYGKLDILEKDLQNLEVLFGLINQN